MHLQQEVNSLYVPTSYELVARLSLNDEKT